LRICAFSSRIPLGRFDDMRSRLQAILSAVLAGAFVRLAKLALRTEARQA